VCAGGEQPTQGRPSAETDGQSDEGQLVVQVQSALTWQRALGTEAAWWQRLHGSGLWW